MGLVLGWFKKEEPKKPKVLAAAQLPPRPRKRPPGPPMPPPTRASTDAAGFTLKQPHVSTVSIWGYSCDRCGAVIPRDRLNLHRDWHSQIDDITVSFMRERLLAVEDELGQEEDIRSSPSSSLGEAAG